MSIIPPLPFTLTNGTTADASQVMADLNQIRDNVNTNAAGGGGSGNVVGPGSAVDGHIAVFDGTTGKIIKDGGAAGTSYRGAVVYNSSNQSLTPSSSDTLAFNSEISDTDAIHSTSVNNSRLMVPAGVTKIRLLAQVGVNGLTAGSDVTIEFLKNGAGISVQPNFETKVNSTYEVVPILGYAMTVIAGDYFEIKIFNQSAGGGATISAQTWFEMQILG